MTAAKNVTITAKVNDSTEIAQASVDFEILQARETKEI